MKPGFILIDNAEVTQIGNQGETKEVAIKNLKLSTADILPEPSPAIELGKRKVWFSNDNFSEVWKLNVHSRN